jgi:hypothetical protein
MMAICEKCNKQYVRHRRPRLIAFMPKPRRPLERDVIPRVIHRVCGGYLAISPDGCALGIGVTADTEEEVLVEFAAHYRKCIEILESSALSK